MRIFLTGMPGSGKSTCGKLLAEQINYPFLDLDEIIEYREGKTISSIFEQDGEDYFREVESAVLKFTVEDNEKMVLSTGGGTPCFLDNTAFMKKHGKVVFLDIPLEILIERLKEEEHRPLLKTEKELKDTLVDLYNKRIAVYQEADYIVTSFEELKGLVDKWGV
jgi:shikimate kinase